MVGVTRMNYSRKRVYRAVRELSRTRERVTYSEIADYANCSYSTARRAIADLILDGKIKVSNSGKGCGFLYEVVNCPR